MCKNNVFKIFLAAVICSTQLYSLTYQIVDQNNQVIVDQHNNVDSDDFTLTDAENTCRTVKQGDYSCETLLDVIEQWKLQDEGAIEYGNDKKPSLSPWETTCRESGDAVVKVHCYANDLDLLQPYKTPYQRMGVGTGFFISQDGYILTNFHVVRRAVALYITIPVLGKKQFLVEYVGASPRRDVALLKLTDQSLQEVKDELYSGEIPCLTLGNSDALVEAQPIMALGYPLASENLKASKGHVSGRQRSESGECIQTTIPINPGNSGGPIFDIEGKVVGMCVTKFVGPEIDNIGHLIPINNVTSILKDMRETKIVKPPFVGLNIVPTTSETLHYLGNPDDGGMYIARVRKGSLAEECGIKKGDVIYAINGIKLDGYGYMDVDWSKNKVSCEGFVERLELGSSINITLYRKGEKVEVQGKLRSACDFKIDQYYQWIDPHLDYEVIFGMVMVQLTSNHISIFKEIGINDRRFNTSYLEKYDHPEHLFEPRVIMTDILPTSFLYHHDSVMVGDLIVEKINDVRVKTIDDVREAILLSKGKEYLTVETEGGSFFALPLRKVLTEEELLSRRHGYAISSLVHELKVSLMNDDEEDKLECHSTIVDDSFDQNVIFEPEHAKL